MSTYRAYQPQDDCASEWCLYEMRKCTAAKGWVIVRIRGFGGV